MIYSKLPLSVGLIFCTIMSFYGQTAGVFRGIIIDERTHKALEYATIQLFVGQKQIYGGISDANGRFEFQRITPQDYKVVISYLGYDSVERAMRIERDTAITFYLKPSALALNEVIVTASESKQATSASVINRTAMKHLQPSSFTDLLELIPGGKAVDPQMGKANLIRIREAGKTDDISSAGVGFYIDGVQRNADASLQYMPSGSTALNATGSVSKGIDMRMIPTDNIEQVEIVRGIPSVAYGNVTGGAVIIKRMASERPFAVRFKADKTSKLFSAGKGIRLDGNGQYILNTDLGYLISKIDPRNSFKDYTRLTASIRLDGKQTRGSRYISWNLSADYTGSFDRAKRDKDATAKEDAYKTTYNSLGIAGKWRLTFPSESWLREAGIHTSAGWQWEKMSETRTVGISRPTAVATLTDTGVSDGTYLPFNYVAQMEIDGKPFYATVKAHTQFVFPSGGKADNRMNLGIEWNYQKNFGEGQVFDLTRPISELLTIRPRRFKDIPSLQPLALYAEERYNLPIAQHRLALTAGIRMQSLLGLDSRYRLQGKFYTDFRFDLQWHLPVIADYEMVISGGWGQLSRMPTTAQLFPDFKYIDLVQLNYYHENPDFRRINIRTYKWDHTNYNLKPARNTKWEVRADISSRGNRLSVTYFRERMDDAFDALTYFKSFPYQLYEVSSIDGSKLTAPPQLSDMSYTDAYNLDVYSTTGNTLKVHKQGIEFQFSSRRFAALKTRFTINGAWFKTIYSSATPEYKASSILLNNKQLKYIGRYAAGSGTESQSFNTNVMFDTFIQRLGLNFSTSVQCAWFTKRRNLLTNGMPLDYVDESGALHQFLETDRNNIQLQHLVEKYAPSYFELTTIPYYIDINLKAGKRIGKYMNLSLYVNRLAGIYPDYTLRGVFVRSTAASPYFGMEMNLTF